MRNLHFLYVYNIMWSTNVLWPFILKKNKTTILTFLLCTFLRCCIQLVFMWIFFYFKCPGVITLDSDALCRLSLHLIKVTVWLIQCCTEQSLKPFSSDWVPLYDQGQSVTAIWWKIIYATNHSFTEDMILALKYDSTGIALSFVLFLTILTCYLQNLQ